MFRPPEMTIIPPGYFYTLLSYLKDESYFSDATHNLAPLATVSSLSCQPSRTRLSCLVDAFHSTLAALLFFLEEVVVISYKYIYLYIS
jgi:hypothetical protein